MARNQGFISGKGHAENGYGPEAGAEPEPRALPG